MNDHLFAFKQVNIGQIIGMVFSCLVIALNLIKIQTIHLKDYEQHATIILIFT